MADTKAPYLYEFLVRGRADGTVAFHVLLAQEVVDAFGASTTSVSSAMTPAQAATLGFGLPAIVSGINRDTAAENEALKAEAAANAQTIASLRSSLSTAEAALAAREPPSAATESASSPDPA